MNNDIDKSNLIKLFKNEIIINLLKKNPWIIRKKPKKIVNKKKDETKKDFFFIISNLEFTKIKTIDDIITKYDIANVVFMLKEPFKCLNKKQNIKAWIAYICPNMA